MHYIEIETIFVFGFRLGSGKAGFFLVWLKTPLQIIQINSRQFAICIYARPIKTGNVAYFWSIIRAFRGICGLIPMASQKNVKSKKTVLPVPKLTELIQTTAKVVWMKVEFLLLKLYMHLIWHNNNSRIVFITTKTCMRDKFGRFIIQLQIISHAWMTNPFGFCHRC